MEHLTRWLRQVANARVHAKIFFLKKKKKKKIYRCRHLPSRGRLVRSLITPVRKAIVGYQHPLAVYEDLMPGGDGMNDLQHERITVLA